jgi:hypothetical protein
METQMVMSTSGGESRCVEKPLKVVDENEILNI